MAYTVVPTVSTGDLWTAANHNTYIRDNFAAGVPDIFTTKGDIAVATGNDVATRLGVGVNGQVIEALSSETSGLKWRGRHFAHANRSTAQAISSGSITLIQYDNEISDDDAIQTIGASYKLTVPAAGLWLCNAKLAFNSASWTAGNVVNTYVYKNNASWLSCASNIIVVTATQVVSFIMVMLCDLAASDYVDVRIDQNSGGSRDLNTFVQWARIR